MGYSLLKDGCVWKDETGENRTADKTVEWSIAPKALTIKEATLADKTYDSTKNGTVSSVSFNETDVFPETNNVSATAEFRSADADESATADVTVTVSDSNFKLENGSIEATGKILRKPIAVDTVTVSDKDYDGTNNAEVTGVTFNGLVDGESLTASDYTALATFDDENVGSRTATVTVSLNDTVKNYSLSDAAVTKSVTANITRKPIAAPTKKEGTLTYNGAAQSGITGYDETEEGYSLKDGTTVSEINAGEYTATFTLDSNYCWVGNSTSDITITWKIEPKAITDVTLSYDSIEYDGTDKEPEVTVKSEDKTLKADEDYTVTYSSNKEVGNATVKVDGKGNYTGTISKIFEITAAPEVPKTDQTLTFAKSEIAGTYGEEVTGQIAVNDKADGGAITYESSNAAVVTVDNKGALIVKGVGTTVITATAAETDKYKKAEASYKVTVAEGKQAAPAVAKTDETIEAKGDGTITGVDSTMEYRKEGEITYTSITSTELANLAPGTYYVRVKAKANYAASEDTKVVIAAGKEEDIIAEISYAENVPVETKEQTIVKTNTDNKDIDGSVQKYLMPKATAKKQTVKLTWNKIKSADGYIIYGELCGKKLERVKEIANGSTKSATFKKLKKGKYYKYVVVAYKTASNGKQKVITTSKTVHVVTDGGKKGNPTGLKLKKSKITVKAGKKATIKASIKYKKKVATHVAKIRYESADTSIATVGYKTGVVKGVKKGKTTIYVFAQNGICKKVTVTVK